MSNISSSSSSSSFLTSNPTSSVDENIPVLPSLFNPSEETPYFIAKLLLESYRERLIQVFNFIDDVANARRTIQKNEIDTIISSLVEYLMVGENAYIQARTAARLHQARYDEWLTGEEKLNTLRTEFHTRIQKLQTSRSELHGILRESYTLLDSITNGNQVPVSAVETAKLAHHMAQGLPLPVYGAWKPGLPYDTPLPLTVPIVTTSKPLAEGEQSILATVSSSSSSLSSSSLTNVNNNSTPTIPLSSISSLTDDTRMDISRDTTYASDRRMDDSVPVAVSSRTDNVLSSSSLSTSSVSSSTVSSSTVPSTLVPSVTSSNSSSLSNPANLAKLMKLLPTLPVSKRMEILKLFPPGYRPGQPLPPNMPSIEEILQRLGS